MQTLIERIEAAVFGGMAAAFVARGLGLPWWRDWEIGDATDVGVCTALAIFFALRALRARNTDNAG